MNKVLFRTICVISSFFFVPFITDDEKRTLAADEHTHSAACYEGIYHENHSEENGCYAQAEELCRGTLRDRGALEWYSNRVYVKWGRCTNTRYQNISRNYCPNYMTSTEAQTEGKQDNPSGRLSYIGLYIYAYKYSKNGGPIQTTSARNVYEDKAYYNNYEYCSACGKRMSNFTVNYAADMLIVCRYYTCSVCNEEFLSCDMGETDYYSGKTHGMHTVKKLVCNRRPGAYYRLDSNGIYVECEPACHRMIVNLKTDKEDYYCGSGSLPEIYGEILLQNGTKTQVRCSYEIGTEAGMLNPDIKNETQKVRIRASDGNYIYKCGEVFANVIINDDITFTITTGLNGKVRAFFGNTTIIVGENSEKTISCPSDLKVELFIEPNPGYEASIEEKENEYKVFFNPKTYKVTYNANGGSFLKYTSLTSNQTFGKKYGTGGFVPANPVRNGYLFGGWCNDKEGNDIISIKSEYSIDGDSTVFAKWIKVTEKEIVKAKYEDRLVCPSAFEVLGFTRSTPDFFKKEEKNGNGYGESVINNSLIKEIGEIYCYGQWIPNRYKVIFDGLDLEKEVVFHSYYGELPVPEGEAGEFDGWYNEKTEGKKINKWDIVTEAEDIYLYPRWTTEDFNLSLQCIPYRINNEVIRGFAEDGNPIVNYGDKLDYVVSLNVGTLIKSPVQLIIKPSYYRDEQPVHVFSTTAVGNTIIGFFERGKDYTETLERDVLDTTFETNVTYVLPYLSYIVEEDNYENLLKYSEINTLSGKEYFFAPDGRMELRFDISVIDSEGNVYSFEAAMKIHVTK